MRVLLTGASGQLGAYLLRELAGRDGQVVAWSGSQTGELGGVALRAVDLGDSDAVARAFGAARPDIVLHVAAMARVADCYRDPPRAERVNTHGTALLAELAGRAAARLLYASTDLVFDGEKGGYREPDAPRPLSVYGRTKAAAEPAVLASPRGVVARLSLLYGPGLAGRPSFFDQQVAALREGKPCRVFEDEWRTPLALHTAAAALLAVARSDFTGLLHLGGPERMTRLEMGRRLAAFLACDPGVLEPMSRGSITDPEPRPRDTSLDTALWRCLFPRYSGVGWEESLRAMMT
jgi:dTDP-4-dehydrorhamnose reductase